MCVCVSGSHPIVIDDIVGFPAVQHLLVPLHQSLGFGYLLLRRVAVEDIVITLTGWARPDVGCHEPGDKR